jgi:hypothetical protein
MPRTPGVAQPVRDDDGQRIGGGPRAAPDPVEVQEVAVSVSTCPRW